MHLITTILAGASLAAAAVNTSAEYQLKTELKPGQTGKEDYECLYLTSYHTGAGLSDAVLTTVRPEDHYAYLGTTNVTGNGTQYYNQLFNFSNPFPWGLEMEENVNFYAAWEPVRINAGVGGSDFEVSGFFINETGLQWTSNPTAPGTISDAFGGWIVCDWWHGVPQLFFRISYYTTPAPSSCADVYLVPEYLSASGEKQKRQFIA